MSPRGTARSGAPGFVFRLQNLGFEVQDVGGRVWNLGPGLKPPPCRVRNLHPEGFRVEVAGVRVQGVEGAGLTFCGMRSMIRVLPVSERPPACSAAMKCFSVECWGCGTVVKLTWWVCGTSGGAICESDTKG